MTLFGKTAVFYVIDECDFGLVSSGDRVVNIHNAVRNKFVRISTRRKTLKYEDFQKAGYPSYKVSHSNSFTDMYKWCDEKFGVHNVVSYGYTFIFQDEKQMALFMLRWQ